MTTVAIDLPDDLAAKARQAGLLRPDALRKMLEFSLRRQAAKELSSIADKMAAAEIPPMSMEDIQAEIRTDRAEMRAKRASGS